MIRLDGIAYITATEAPDHLGDDVDPAMVRDWHRRKLIVGYRVGKEVYYRLEGLVEVEYTLRTSGRGRPRRVA